MGQPNRFSLIELVIVVVVVGVLAVTALPRFLPEENAVSDQAVTEEPAE